MLLKPIVIEANASKDISRKPRRSPPPPVFTAAESTYLQAPSRGVDQASILGNILNKEDTKHLTYNMQSHSSEA